MFTCSIVAVIPYANEGLGKNITCYQSCGPAALDTIRKEINHGKEELGRYK